MPLILNGDTGISGVDGTAGTPSLQGTDNNTGVFYATDIVGIATNGTERMRIDSSGNVGIGTNSPASRLDVNGTIRASAASCSIAVIPSTTTNQADFFTQNAGGTFYIGLNNSTGTYFGGTAYSANLYVNNALPIVFSTTATERMRIDSSGNVGIGTSSFPADTNLTVLGNFQTGFYRNVTSGGRGYFINIGAKTSGGFADGAYVFGAVDSGDATGYLTFGTRSGGSTGERMRITSNGTVIVAATSSSFDTTYSVLQISSTGALVNYAPTGDVNITSGLYYASGEWKYTTTGLKGSRFQVASQGIQAIAGTNASPTAGGSVTQSTILFLTYNNTLALQDATQSAGTGIAFPATQNASSNANTLDDYEEGTFTATIQGTSTAGTATYSQQNARYTKIGRMVQFEIYLGWSSGTGTGNLQIGGLPFTCNNASTFPGVAVGYVNNIALNANNLVTAYVNNNATTIIFIQYPTGGGTAANVSYDSAGEFVVCGTYTV